MTYRRGRMQEGRAGGLSLGLGLLVAAIGLGCSADPAGMAAPDGTIEPDGADVPNPNGTLKVFVADWAGLTLLEAAQRPLIGAAVALDTPDGERLQAFTNDRGEASFSGFHWRGEPAAVTVFKPGYALVSAVGLTEGYVKFLGGVLRVDARPSRPAQPPRVRLWGSVRGMQSTRNILSLGSPQGIGYHEAGGPAWMLEVHRERVTALVALEIEHVGEGVSPRGTAKRLLQGLFRRFRGVPRGTPEVPLSFEPGALPLYESHGAIQLPARADSPLRRDTKGTVFVLDKHLLSGSLCRLGIATHIDIDAEGEAFDFTVSWIQPPANVNPFTMLSVQDPGYRFRSWRYVDGYPRGLLTRVALPDLPRLVDPPHTWSGHPLRSPLQFERFEPGLAPYLEIRSDDALVWEIHAPPGASSIRFPEPPTATGPRTALGNAPLTGRLMLVEWHASGWYATRGSEIVDIELLP